jgi:predicted RNA-binding protein with PUA-like domain
MASQYLLKTEPSEYSFEDLKRDGETVWDGVRNPVARKHLSRMKTGDKLVVYETGDRRSAVGTAVVLGVDTSNSQDPAVKIKAGKRLSELVTLAQIKGNPLFADSPLVRQGRLSVVPLTTAQYESLVGS